MQVAASVDVAVDLRDPDARGIHMSRLYLRLQDAFAAEAITPGGLRRVLDDLVDSQQGLSASARLAVRYEHLLQRGSLASGLQGWKGYPVAIEAVLRDGHITVALAPFVAAAGAVSAAIAAGEDALPAGSGDGLAALAASLSAMRALAGAGDSAAAGTLSRTWPPRPAGTRADRVFTALARERLRALDASAGNRALPAWHTLWIAWRAGRSFPPA
jgi:hypothetical protein